MLFGLVLLYSALTTDWMLGTVWFDRVAAAVRLGKRELAFAGVPKFGARTGFSRLKSGAAGADGR